MLKGKTVVLGVTGSIAAYKAADIVSLLKKSGAKVKVIMTHASKNLIGEITLQTLSGCPVYSEMFNNPASWEIDHISLAKSADAFVVAPASANVIGKIANGIADDMLTTTAMATEAIKIIAPAMNSKMYLNPIVQLNMDKLKSLGYKFVEPVSGILACGDEGIGKLASPEHIVRSIEEALSAKPSLHGKRFVITAGPTVESIDPVRYITNHSSGKMGYALAREASARGAEVVLISGPVHLLPPGGCRIIQVKSAVEMNDAVLEESAAANVIIKSAAVSDYRPKQTNSQKIKKTKGPLILELERNPDILDNLGKIKNSNQLLIGFAAETENLIANATEKLNKKNLDMIVANNIASSSSGFKSDMNKATLLFRDGKRVDLDLMSKIELSRLILDEIELLLGKI